jgi:hypothetical protein
MSEKNIDYTSTESDYEYVYDSSNSSHYDYKTTNPEYIKRIRKYRKIDKFCIRLCIFSIFYFLIHMVFTEFINLNIGWLLYCAISPFVLFGLSLAIGLPNCAKHSDWINNVWENSEEYETQFKELCDKESKRQEKIKREKAKKLVEIYSTLENKKLTKENKIELLKDYMGDR